MSTTVDESVPQASAPSAPSVWFHLAFRLVVETALAVQFVVAAFYWYLSPKGFPVEHSRFWLNTVAPFAVIVLTVSGLLGMLRRRYGVAAFVVFCFTSGWAAGAIAARVVFPVSLHRVWILPLLVAFAGALCFALLIRGERKAWALWIPASLLSACAALGIVWSQVPPPPDTRPINESPPPSAVVAEKTGTTAGVELSEDCTFYPTLADLVMKQATTTIRCSPLLEFDRISSDSFWSVFAPSASTSTRKLESEGESADGSRTFQYSDGSTIALTDPTSTGGLELVAFAPLDEDTFSHLNTFTVIRVSGHRKLFLSFSPCPDAMVEVLPADYPTGRPARFAYLDDLDLFHVVEASSGEKGPFHSLATGQLRRGEPLAISLYDEEELVAEVELKDWSHQLSTTLSPTAGWGVPMNAIEFQLNGDKPNSPATIWITLAATSVGRGWDSVGHVAGIYRNRIVLRPGPL